MPSSSRGKSDPRLERLVEVMAALDLAPTDLQVFDPEHPRFDAARSLLVLEAQFEAARSVLDERYPSTHEARAVLEDGVRASTAGALPREATGWWLAALAPEHDVRSLSGLRGVMERLYGPNGCPWDREQTHESLRKYLLEEAYELVDAVDRGDLGGLREELGDLLAHVLMHTAMAQERGEFSLEDVVEGGARKMVRRHPHVFGDEVAGSNEELLQRWEEIKAAERASGHGRTAGEPAQEGALESVPRAAPALQRAQSLQERATRAGALEPALPSMQALARAIGAFAAGTPSNERLGGLLWAAVRVARDHKLDAEEALREAAGRFTEAFESLEAEGRAARLEVSDLSAEQREGPWRVPGAQ